MSPHLECLPVEVQVSILCRLDSIEMLFTALKASPRLFQIYQGNRLTIYSRIVYTLITPFIIPAAVSSFYLSDRGTTIETTTFTTAYHRSNEYDYSDLSVEDWRCLLRTHRVINEVISDSVARAFRIAGLDLSPQYFGGDVSCSEYCRLIRAFYNWEFFTAICSQYLRARLLTLEASDAQESLQSLQAFLEIMLPYELEEMLFVHCYLRGRLYDFIDQAEDDRFDKWKAGGPYKCRNMFRKEEYEPSIWNCSFRGKQDVWLEHTLYGERLAVIHRIVNESKPGARMECLEAIDLDSNARWTVLGKALERHRDLAASDLMSPLLPYEWRSRDLPSIDWSDIQFTDSIERPNLGLLWGCRESHSSSRPNFRLLDQMSTWGAAIWDAKRLQTMLVLRKSPDFLGLGEDFAIVERPPRRKKSILSRTLSLDDQWVDAGLMADETWFPPGEYEWCEDEDEDEDEVEDDDNDNESFYMSSSDETESA